MSQRVSRELSHTMSHGLSHVVIVSFVMGTQGRIYKGVV